MTAPSRTRTAQPESQHRPDSLRYFRDFRTVVWAVVPNERGVVSYVDATVLPADGDRYGQSVRVAVFLRDGVWGCDEHPGENSCGHRLVVQMATGWGHLGGRWRA